MNFMSIEVFHDANVYFIGYDEDKSVCIKKKRKKSKKKNQESRYEGASCTRVMR